jgi:hypothetical protein
MITSRAKFIVAAMLNACEICLMLNRYNPLKALGNWMLP